MSTQELTFTYSTNNDGALTITEVHAEGPEPLTELEIPATLEIDGKDMPVAGVHFDSYMREVLANLKEVVLPEGLEFIGNSCFRDMALEHINFPSTLKSIGDSAFCQCRQLRKVILPEGLDSVEEFAFCKVGTARRRTRLYVPSTAVIQDYAFSEGVFGHTEVKCGVISENAFSQAIFKTLKLGDGISKIMDNAFSYSNAISLLDHLPASLRYIGDKAFASAGANISERGHSLVIPDGVEVGESVFENCPELHKVITGSSTWKSLIQSYNTFKNSGIEEVTIPEDVNYIGIGVCANCRNLKSVDIPPTVLRIENDAFMGSGLQSVSVPDSVIDIGGWAFTYLADCRDIQASLEVWRLLLQGHTITGNGMEHITLPEGIVDLCANSLSECHNLRSVTLPQSLMRIGESAFEKCTMLQSISIPQGVVCLDTKAFAGCYSLRRVELPESLESIGCDCFNDCRALEVLDIPEGVDHIGIDVFANCDSLKRLVFRGKPDTVAWPCDCRFSVDWYVPDDCLEYVGQLCKDTRRILPQSQLTPLALLPKEEGEPEGMKRLRICLSFSQGFAMLAHEVEPKHMSMLGGRENAHLLMSGYLHKDISNCKITPFASLSSTSCLVMDNCYRRLEFHNSVTERVVPVASPFATALPTLMQPFCLNLEVYSDFFVDENESFNSEKLEMGTFKIGCDKYIDTSRICYDGEWHPCKVRFSDWEDEYSMPANTWIFKGADTTKMVDVVFYSHDGETELIAPTNSRLIPSLKIDYLRQRW